MKKKRAAAPKSVPKEIPSQIRVLITQDHIREGGKTFSFNPVVAALQQADWPVESVGPDMAYIGGVEFLALKESADTFGNYLFGEQKLVPYTHQLERATPETVNKRTAIRRKENEASEKLETIRET